MNTTLLSRDEELYWLALKLVPNLGSRLAGKLLERFKTPQAIFRASRTSSRRRISGGVAQASRAGCLRRRAGQHEKMAACRSATGGALRPALPALLREIFDPPIVLFARGRVELLGAVAVGWWERAAPLRMGCGGGASRRPGHAGMTIVSGMARGIDTAAHKGAPPPAAIRWRYWAAGRTWSTLGEPQAGGGDRCQG
jgi:DNA processing protein